MGIITPPSKEQVREWLARRRAERKPLPEPQQLRHELGWGYFLEVVLASADDLRAQAA